MEEMRATKQRLAGLEQEDQWPLLAMETDVKPDTNTRKCMKDVTAERVMSGDNPSAQVDTDPMCLTSFGDDSTGPPALSCTRDDALVDNSAGVPKPYLSPVEMCTRTAAGGLLPAGAASTAMRAIFPRPFLSWSLGETRKRTSQINNQLVPFWRRVIHTKPRQSLMFDPGGPTKVVHTPTRFSKRGVRCFVERVLFGRRMVPEAGAFFGKWITWNIILLERYKQIVYAVRIAVDRGLSAAGLDRGNVRGSQNKKTGCGYSCGGERMSRNAIERA